MTSFGGWDDDEDDDEPPRPPLDDQTASRVARSFRIVRLVNLGLLLAAAIGIALLAWLTQR
jgi:hypothetical protein